MPPSSGRCTQSVYWDPVSRGLRKLAGIRTTASEIAPRIDSLDLHPYISLLPLSRSGLDIPTGIAGSGCRPVAEMAFARSKLPPRGQPKVGALGANPDFTHSYSDARRFGMSVLVTKQAPDFKSQALLPDGSFKEI